MLSSIEEQGEKLSEELQCQIQAASTLVAVEDLYRPIGQNAGQEQRLPKKEDWNLWLD